MKTYKRVDKCGTLELRKDGQKHSAIYRNGVLIMEGNSYMVGQHWLRLKAKYPEVI